MLYYNITIYLIVERFDVKMIKNRLLGNILALFFGIFILILILLSLETFLRFKYDDPAKSYYSFNADLINHVALFRRSFLPLPTHPQPKIFCLGGSTTNGCNMPIPKSYPNLLDALFKHNKKKGMCYNFGISGVNSVTTNYFIKNILPKYDPACVVIHDGYNDLPIVIKKIGDDKYEYITPDYNKPFNPHIKNPVIRYIISFIKFNLRATRRFTVTFVKKKLKKGGDLFLGFDYKKYKMKEGTSKEIFEENKKRLRIMVKAELDSIEFCLANDIKVIVIAEPYIKPMHFVHPFSTGFRDKYVGEILSRCHKIQQTIYLAALQRKYGNNKNVKLMDMREVFKGKYNELFYDECHLNGVGNAIKARFVYGVISQLFELESY